MDAQKTPLERITAGGGSIHKDLRTKTWMSVFNEPVDVTDGDVHHLKMTGSLDELNGWLLITGK